MNEARTTQHEPRDARVGVTVATAASLVAGLGLCGAIAAWICRNEIGAKITDENSFRHGPAERSSIVRDWEQQDVAVEAHLRDYAWVDRQAGVVRIPVERAMDLMMRDAEQKTKAAR